VSEPDHANPDKLVHQHRTSIGVLQADLGNWYGTPYLSGIADLAEAEDVNLLCFIGQKLDQGDNGQNQVYRLATGRRLDGLIFYASLGHWASRERVTEFCDRYAMLPRVGNALPIDCLPMVLPDSYAGMRQAITHLVEVHGCQRVAFIQGPVGQLEAEQRYQAYCDVLVEHGLELDPALVVAGDYQHDAGRSAVRILRDNRQVNFDGLAAAND
jgi:phosphoserine phosphatase RsbU/P